MTDDLEMQFSRPLMTVEAVDPEQLDLRRESVQHQVDKRIDDELVEFRLAREALVKAQAKFHDLQAQFCREAEQQLLGLSMEIARKVLMQEIQAGRHEVDPIVREALSRLPTRMDAVVHLHPDDLARCELASKDEESPDAEDVSFVADSGVCRGECLVQTSHGTVESSIEGHIEEISKALTEPE